MQSWSLILFASSISAFRETISPYHVFFSSDAIWKARCLLFDISGPHFCTPGAPWETILAPRNHHGDPFWHLGSTLGRHFRTSGPPWRTMEAAGWTRSCPSQDFCRFWTDFGTCLCQFLGFKMHKFSFQRDFFCSRSE